MLARLLHESGINMGPQDKPNRYFGLDGFEPSEIRAISDSLVDGRPKKGGDIVRAKCTPAPEKEQRLRNTLDKYQGDGVKLPRILQTWDVWKRVIPKKTVVLLMNRESIPNIDSLVRRGRLNKHNAKALYIWAQKHKGYIRQEWEHVIDIWFRHLAERSWHHIIEARLKYHFPNTTWNFENIHASPYR